jgi:hypothetical protein
MFLHTFIAAAWAGIFRIIVLRNELVVVLYYQCLKSWTVPWQWHVGAC